MPMAQGDSSMWGKDLRSAVGLSKKNGPCEDSFFWAVREKFLLWSSGPLHLLGQSSPAGLGAELGASCPARVSCGCRARGMPPKRSPCTRMHSVWTGSPVPAAVAISACRCHGTDMLLTQGNAGSQLVPCRVGCPGPRSLSLSIKLCPLSVALVSSLFAPGCGRASQPALGCKGWVWRGDS